MGSLRQSCVFCERILQRRSGIPWDRPLAETADYFVVPTKGSLVAGWVLVVSRMHAVCSGALSSGAVDALAAGIGVAKTLVEPGFGPLTLFEHGPAAEGTALGCGVDHLHIHAAPLAFSLRAEFTHLYPASIWRQAQDWQELRAIHAAGISYVAIQEPGRPLEWCDAPANVRQPLRRAVAAGIGAYDQFDYNLHPHQENVSRTIEVLSAV